MDIELDQTSVAHFQKEGLASFRIRDIGAPVSASKNRVPGGPGSPADVARLPNESETPTTSNGTAYGTCLEGERDGHVDMTDAASLA